MKKYFIALTFISFACSENYSEKNDSNSIIIDLKNQESIIEKEFLDLFAIDTVIELQFNDDFHLADIYRLEINADGIFALDPILGNLIRYSRKGVPINKIGLPGDGPSEMPEIFDFSYDFDKRELLLGSYSARKISRFKPDGEFVSSIKLIDQLDHFSYNNNRILVSMSYYNALFKNLILLDDDGDSLRTFFPFPFDLKAISLKFVSGHSTTSMEDGFLFNEPASSSIYSINSDGNSYVKYQFTSGEDMWPEVNKNLIQDFFQTVSSGNLTYLTRFYEESEDHLFFNLNLKKSSNRSFVIDPRIGYYDFDNKITYLSKSFEGSLWLRGPLELEGNKFYCWVSKAKIYEFSTSHSLWSDILKIYPNLKITDQSDLDTPILIRFAVKE